MRGFRASTSHRSPSRTPFEHHHRQAATSSSTHLVFDLFPSAWIGVFEDELGRKREDKALQNWISAGFLTYRNPSLIR